MGKYFHSTIAGVAIFLILGAVVQAVLDPTAWRHARRILLRDAAAPEAYVLVELDRAVYQAAQLDLDDLRIVDDRGKEIPLAVIVTRDESTDEERDAEILDRQLTPDGVYRFVLDLGENPPRHNRIELTSPSRNFSRRVAVEAGDDARQWAMIRQDGYIFDFSRDTTASYLRVDYPVSSARYLRVSIFNRREEPIEVADASVSFFLSRPARLVTHDARLKERVEDSKQKLTRIIIDLGVSGLPSSRLDLESPTRNFQRRVEIEGRNTLEEAPGTPREYWSPVGNGQVFSIDVDRVKRRQLELDFSETRYRFLRLTIHNHDDQPLDIPAIKVQGYPRQVLFHREPGRNYLLLYGHRTVTEPRYDLANMISYLKLGELESVTLGEEVQTGQPSGPEQRKPWLDRQPIALWITLVLAALLLGGLIYRLARKINAD